MLSLIKEKTQALATSRTASYALGILIVMVVLSYVYFANSAVRTLAALENTKVEVQNLSSDVSDFESKRLARENSVSSSLATQMGFVEVSHPTFLIKNSKQTALSYKTR